MGQFLILLVVAAIAVGLVFGVVVLATGKDDGLRPVSADGVSIGLPPDRPLSEDDVLTARFDTGLRGYRTGQVDDALARLAYDVGFKDELIKVLVSEVQALRDGRSDDAERLRLARAKAIGETTVDTRRPPVDGADAEPSAVTDDAGAPAASPVRAPADTAGEPSTPAETQEEKTP
ncbi:DivIVA domain-containing protein [Phytomonospora endophytica]|uniref:DivIVA domain-containing protein n=1 Tax=Phytomonospora endophytica TaxID=714109 RepID=A0A841FI13_9ACTN|nr:DivIVA domain-containing protein [Phytomonospora endophytica]MBB6033222.1 DivIVA domain-containing protein [Phytomonospora endophytica]GIG65449.1 hypothetical protein Pen01_17440 [Phytomonospora endophytica]